ncbi:MAG TPA: transcription elongation factor GreA [Candidatus Magasanikbacteria bacterium]|nr:transcription elongation factor GreA [Candidatus Magasanikbacteria bacterium]
MRTLDRKPGTYTHVKLDPLITGWKFDELKKKLETLKKVSQPKASNEVARLAEMGDFSENAAYQMAKGRLRGINNTIARLENQINHAVIIKTQDQKDTIEIGHTVTVESKGKQKKFQILGSTETNPSHGVISYTSPLGAVLMGHGVGDAVTVGLGDRKVSYTIVAIE